MCKKVTVRRTAAAIKVVEGRKGRKERDITNVKGNETRL